MSSHAVLPKAQHAMIEPLDQAWLTGGLQCSLADNDWKEEATANFIHAVRKFFVCDNISGADRLSVSVFFHDRIRNTLQPQEFRRSFHKPELGPGSLLRTTELLISEVENYCTSAIGEVNFKFSVWIATRRTPLEPTSPDLATTRTDLAMLEGAKKSSAPPAHPVPSEPTTADLGTAPTDLAMSEGAKETSDQASPAQPVASVQPQAAKHSVSSKSLQELANLRINPAKQKQIGEPEVVPDSPASLERILFVENLPDFGQSLLLLLSAEDRRCLSSTCREMSLWVAHVAPVYRTRGPERRYAATYCPKLSRKQGGRTPYNPHYPSPVIFRWEGRGFWPGEDTRDEAINAIIAAFTEMLKMSSTIRIIEISRVHGLSPEWLRVSRLKDFAKLSLVKIEYCAPWDMEMFDVPNNYQQSLLDLSIGHDVHWDLDFFAYDARGHKDWNSMGPAGSRSIFEGAYEFFRDRHPHLLLKGTLVNTMLAQLVINDPYSVPPSAVRRGGSRGLQEEVSLAIQESLYEYPRPGDVTRFFLSLVRMVTPKWQRSANYNRQYDCVECSGSFTGYCFPHKQIHGMQSDESTCGGCSRKDVHRRHMKLLRSELIPCMGIQRGLIYEALVQWLENPSLDTSVKYTEISLDVTECTTFNNPTSRTTYTFEQSPSIRYMIQSITKKDPLKQLEGEKRFVVKTLKSLTSEHLRIDRSPEVGPRNLHRVRVPDEKDEQKEQFEHGEQEEDKDELLVYPDHYMCPDSRQLPPRPKPLIPSKQNTGEVPDTATSPAIITSATEPITHISAPVVPTQNTERIPNTATEPATHSSAFVTPTVYDADLLLRICPAHLMGFRCNREIITGAKCDRLLICEYVMDYVCEGTTCQYLHSIPRSCLAVKWHGKCREGCTDAHDFMDARTENAKELADHCQRIRR